MKIELAGNPFVDTGLAVIASLCKLDDITKLTLDDLIKIHGDGEELADRNSKLKSMSLLFTINSILLHPTIKPAEKKKEYYKAITTAFVKNIGKETVDEYCESCGNTKSLDLNKIFKETVGPIGKDENRVVGRDWFPLSGSLGSDAQALPAASRSLNLCSVCLIAVHYLPLGVILWNGKLTLYQSTSIQFWYELVRDIVSSEEGYLPRIQAGNFEILGKKEGNAAIIRRILSIMQKMKKESEFGTLFVWKFSNFGNKASCEIDEIPNNALRFLHKAVNEGYRSEIEEFVSREDKSKSSLLNSITKSTDYKLLYPFKKFKGATPGFYKLYQTTVRGKSTNSLNVALKISKYIHDKKERGEIKEKEINEWMKKLELRDSYGYRNQIKSNILEMVEKGILKSSDYITIFPYDGKYIMSSWDGWHIIKYYLHHNDEMEENETEESEKNKNGRIREDVYRFAQITFKEFSDEKGTERFRREVFDAAKHHKIFTPWLKKQFLKNALKYSGFTYDDWKSLCFDSDGKEKTIELLYQLRLVWAELLNSKEIGPITDHIPSTTLPHRDDLPYEIESAVREFTRNYDQEQLKNDITDLIRGELGLWWFRQQLQKFEPKLKSDTYWDYFCTDTNGNSFKAGRFFQLSLCLVNEWRESYIQQTEKLFL